MQPIELVLRPATQPGTYWPVLDGQRLTKATRQPFFDGARALLADGVASDAPLISRHEGSQTIAMQSTVGEAAKWSVSEADRGGLSKRPFRPWNADSSHPGNSPGDDEAEGASTEPLIPHRGINGASTDEHPRGISHDPGSKIAARFAGAQSDFGKRLVPRHMPPVDPAAEEGDMA